MGDTPQTQNPAIKTADEIIQAILYDLGVNAVIKVAQAEMPWLAWPIVSQIFRYLVGQVAGLLYSQLETFVAFRIIEKQIANEKAAYDASVQELKNAHASGDQNAIDKAKVDFKATLGRLIHFNGS